jgi:DNA helicase-2/ATP-dependent DNA helicase PcrA
MNEQHNAKRKINLVPREQPCFGDAVAFPLNPAQKRAVEHQCGPLLVLAGAGSGKTRVITQRIARLAMLGIPARSIVALTFTNKAAGEMRERVEHILKEAGAKGLAKELTVCTFHAFGLSVLSQESPKFTIFDQGDAISTVREAMRSLRMPRKLDTMAVLSRISLAKNAFLTPEEMPDDDDYDEIAKEVYPRYQAMLRAFRAYDFDDLVCEVVRLFRRNPDARARWQNRFQYVLVDEYQDTNRAQLELLLALGEAHKNVCVVGDDDQAIYGWRGADVRNILEFEEQFEGAEVIKLEQNYRSTKPILDVANAVIAKRNDVRHRKTLFSNQPGGNTVELFIAPTPEIEADWVAAEIKRLQRDDHLRLKDMAVLYRSNAQSRAIEQAFRENGISYRTVGGQQFFDRKEVKDVLAYLRVALAPHDEISLRRIINYPSRGIGETSLERLAAHANAKGTTLWKAIESASEIEDMPSGSREGCEALATLVRDVRAMIDAKQPAVDAAQTICDRIALKNDLEDGAGSLQAATRRWGNVEGLLATIRAKEAKVGGFGTGGLRTFLQALALENRPEEGDDATDVVTLSTLHGAKGLEFGTVFLIGVEEGYLPHARAIDARATDVETDDGAASIEEERRLFYVGVTRAKKRLVMLRCKARAMRGKSKPRTPSRFLSDIPKELLVEKEIDRPPGMTQEQMTAQANALLAALEGLS